MTLKQPHVIIEVEGGVANCTLALEGEVATPQVTIIDWDNIRASDERVSPPDLPAEVFEAYADEWGYDLRERYDGD